MLGAKQVKLRSYWQVKSLPNRKHTAQVRARPVVNINKAARVGPVQD